MQMFALIYYVCDDYVERRKPFREQHLRSSLVAFERGELLMGGALGEPIDRALLVFKAENLEAVEAFAKNDPYVQNGLVERWEVQPWHVVVGQ